MLLISFSGMNCFVLYIKAVAVPLRYSQHGQHRRTEPLMLPGRFGALRDLHDGIRFPSRRVEAAALRAERAALALQLVCGWCMTVVAECFTSHHTTIGQCA